MPPRRKRYLDNVAPADNTANVVRPINRMIQVKQQDTLARREKETREYQARQERVKYTPANPRQASIGPYREKTNLDKQGGRLYAEAEQRRKDAEDREAAGVVLNSLFKPILPSTYVDMAAAIKNGQVNSLTDALAAPYLSDSWSMRNPGKAILTDVASPLFIKGVTSLNKVKDLVSDIDYMFAAKTGNIKRAQKLRDKHFLEKSKTLYVGDDGKLITAYHTTSNEHNPNFWQFDINKEGRPSAIYSSDSRSMSKSYARGNNRTKKLYLNIHTPYRFDANNRAWNNIPVPKEGMSLTTAMQADADLYANELNYILHKNNIPLLTREKLKDIPIDLSVEGNSGYNFYMDKLFDRLKDEPLDIRKDVINEVNNLVFEPKHVRYGITTREIEDALRGTNYDSFIVDNVSDYGGRGFQIIRDSRLGKQYNQVAAVFDPKNIKLKNAITYDDKGRIIRLSKRDNFGLNDLRYKYGGIIK